MKIYRNQRNHSMQMEAYRTLMKKYLTFLQSDLRATVDNATEVIENVVQMETTIAMVSYDALFCN